MNIFENVKSKVEQVIENNNSANVTDRFKQFIHRDIGVTHCRWCLGNDRRVFETGTEPETPVHPNCHCTTEFLGRKAVGTISKKGPNGPDYFLKYFGRLPSYYITKAEAKKLGWEEGKDLSKFAPGKMIGGDVYNNKEQFLPEKEGRIWFECDVDYVSGKRNGLRLFYSNDGLMFYSPNHIKPHEAIIYLVE